MSFREPPLIKGIWILGFDYIASEWELLKLFEAVIHDHEMANTLFKAALSSVINRIGHNRFLKLKAAFPEEFSAWEFKSQNKFSNEWEQYSDLCTMLKPQFEKCMQAYFDLGEFYVDEEGNPSLAYNKLPMKKPEYFQEVAKIFCEDKKNSENLINKLNDFIVRRSKKALFLIHNNSPIPKKIFEKTDFYEGRTDVVNFLIESAKEYSNWYPEMIFAILQTDEGKAIELLDSALRRDDREEIINYLIKEKNLGELFYKKFLEIVNLSKNEPKGEHYSLNFAQHEFRHYLRLAISIIQKIKLPELISFTSLEAAVKAQQIKLVTAILVADEKESLRNMQQDVLDKPILITAIETQELEIVTELLTRDFLLDKPDVFHWALEQKSLRTFKDILSFFQGWRYASQKKDFIAQLAQDEKNTPFVLALMVRGIPYQPSKKMKPHPKLKDLLEKYDKAMKKLDSMSSIYKKAWSKVYFKRSWVDEFANVKEFLSETRSHLGSALGLSKTEDILIAKFKEEDITNLRATINEEISNAFSKILANQSAPPESYLAKLFFIQQKISGHLIESTLEKRQEPRL